MEPHHEKYLVVNNRPLKYSGIFKVDELFVEINKALEERDYHKNEKRSEELVTETGRRFYLDLRPVKHKTSYAEYEIRMKITLDNVVDVVMEKDGREQKFQKGDVLIVFDGWLLQDNEHHWRMKPFVFFIKAFINKFLYTWPLEASFEGEVGSDTAFIHNRIKKLLTSYTAVEGTTFSEEDIRKKVEEEMKNET